MPAVAAVPSVLAEEQRGAYKSLVHFGHHPTLGYAIGRHDLRDAGAAH